MTEFHPKMGLSLSLMDQGGTHNPNVTPRGHPNNFFNLLGKVAHTAQENILIGQFAKINSFHVLRCPW